MNSRNTGKSLTFVCFMSLLKKDLIARAAVHGICDAERYGSMSNWLQQGGSKNPKIYIDYQCGR